MRRLRSSLALLVAAGAVVLAHEAGRRRKRVIVTPLIVAGRSGFVVTRIQGNCATSEFRPHVGIVASALAHSADVFALMDTHRPSADAEIVTQLQFSRLAKVTPGRVAQWIAEGKISAAALVGKGRDARIRPTKAFADLKSHLHPGETTPESASTVR